MDRIALSKRLESLAEVFAGHTPMNKDLRAMAHVISNLDDQRYASILSEAYAPEVSSGIGCGRGKGFGPAKQPVIIKVEEAQNPAIPESEACGTDINDVSISAWDKCASEAVLDYLVRDVVAMEKKFDGQTNSKLTPEQEPSNNHKGLPSKPSTLKEEQTPDAAEAQKTDMVKKSEIKGGVRKEAAEEASVKGEKEEEKEAAEGDSNPIAEIKQMQADKLEGQADRAEQQAEKKKNEVEKILEKAEKGEEESEEPAEEPAEEPKEEEVVESSSDFAGIELCASMEDINPDSDEIQRLSRLFQ